MKKVILAVTLALAVAAGTQSTAQARGYTCIYKTAYASYAAYVTMDGSANTPALCRLYGSASHARRVYRAYGPTYCVFVGVEADIRLTVTSPNRLFGRALCSMLPSKMGSHWHRVR